LKDKDKENPLSVSIADGPQRREALDPRASFIVQAPAGSGKTELLTQRMLALLAGEGVVEELRVQRPEEVVAITFTRKAAGEMRQRVRDTLLYARTNPPPLEPHRKAAYDLAQSVLARDAALGWNLPDNPASIRALTIDGFSGQLARRMPVRARLGGVPGVLDPGVQTEVYRQAARETLEALAGGPPEEAKAVEGLLLHRDNQAQTLEDLLADMLATRDQWMRHLGLAPSPKPGLPTALVQSLAQAVQRLEIQALAGLKAAFPVGMLEETTTLARFAAGQLAADHPLAGWSTLTAPPGFQPETLPLWQGVAGWLLTGKDEFRKTVTVKNGFPAADKKNPRFAENKQRMKDLLASLAGNEPLRGVLEELRRLPPRMLAPPQLEALEALERVLPMALGRLWGGFGQTGGVDFSQVALAAAWALNDSGPDGGLPTDRITHLLVDEFQDTSLGQSQLLLSLTRRWKPGDGRTLFLVGDPMQSIYRFREAEVGVFLRAWESQRLGAVALKPLSLQVNFRSVAPLVGWMNHLFSQVFPPRSNAGLGQVAYAKAAFPGQTAPEETPPPPGDPDQAVTLHPFLDREGAPPYSLEEARTVARLVSRITARHPGETLAILVRSRSHLARILPALAEAGVRVQAVEIEPLSGKPVVRDLAALTRALLHPADRVAWLALLRGPWCGLDLKDLLAVAQAASPAEERTIWQAVCSPPDLEPDGLDRLERLRNALAGAVANRERSPLRRLVEGAWMALGGAACHPPEAYGDAEAFLALLEELEAAHPIPDGEAIARRLEALNARPDPAAGGQVQVMTIHKAKGLQFDTVILPGLGRRTKGGNSSLLLWETLPGPPDGGDELLMAPSPVKGGEDPHYEYLKWRNKTKERAEALRLFYVAATRTKKRLHLLAAVKEKKDGTLSPGGLLSHVWPVLEDPFAALLREGAAPEAGFLSNTVQDPSAPGTQGLTDLPPASGESHGVWSGPRRVAGGWAAPLPPESLPLDLLVPESLALGLLAQPPEEQSGLEPVFDWAGDAARHVGTVVHRALEKMADLGEKGDADWVRRRQGLHLHQLRQLGVAADGLAAALNKVQRALFNTLEDERGRWILAPHPHAACELELTGLQGAGWITGRLDRTFVADGIRWIVDYKTGEHLGGDPEAFLDNEQARYREPLARYARLLRLRQSLPDQEALPVRAALYFPLMSAWREWTPD